MTETTAEVYASDCEQVLLVMRRKRTVLAPAEARQLAQELLDAADESEEPPPAPPVALWDGTYIAIGA
jgi:hypothetical protein